MREKEMETFIASVFQEHYAPLRNMCLQRLRNTPMMFHLADDAVQDTFVKLHKKYDRLKDHPNIVGWMFETCKFTLMKLIEKYHREDQHTAFSLDASTYDTLEADNNIEAWIEQLERSLIITELFASLSPKEKLTFHDFFVLDMTIQEIADGQGITSNAVKQCIKRIRGKASLFLKKVENATTPFDF